MRLGEEVGQGQQGGTQRLSQKTINAMNPVAGGLREETLSFFSLVFSKTPRKTSKTPRIFLTLRTLKNPVKQAEQTQKDQGNSQEEKDQGNKNTKEKKDRGVRKIQKTEKKGLFTQISSDFLEPASLKHPFAALQKRA